MFLCFLRSALLGLVASAPQILWGRLHGEEAAVEQAALARVVVNIAPLRVTRENLAEAGAAATYPLR